MAFTCDILLTAAFLLDGWLGTPTSNIARLLNLDGEGNLPAWYSSYKLAIVGAMWGLIAAARWVPSRRWERCFFPALVAVLFTAMSADETASIHEWLGSKADVILPGGQRAGSAFAVTGVWFVVAAPIAVALVVWLVRLAKREEWLDAQTTMLLLTGVGLQLFSAIGVEALTNFFEDYSLGSYLQIAVEEFGEMASVTLVLWATLRAMSRCGFRLPRTEEQEPELVQDSNSFHTA